MGSRPSSTGKRSRLAAWCVEPDPERDADGYEVGTTTTVKIASERAYARELDEQAREATDPAERAFYREQARTARSTAAMLTRRRVGIRPRPRGRRRFRRHVARSTSSNDPPPDEPELDGPGTRSGVVA